MKLNLTKPLIIFDLETTGLDISRDSIIQISYIKVSPDGSEQRRNYFVNPGRPIPAEVTELTHITNEMVADAPTFKELATTLAAEFKGCDFAGYNSNHYDIPLLAEEFLRAGVNFDFFKCRLIDACAIFKQMEKRNLAAAYKCVLQGQLDKYAPGANEDPEKVLHNNMDELNDFCNKSKKVDFAGRMKYNENGVEVFNFGKYKDQPVIEVLKRDPSYYSWILNGDFALDTKQALTRIRLREQMK